MNRVNLKPASLAVKAGSTDATVSNWLNDNIRLEHVKALQLFKIADAAQISPRELLLGDQPSRYGVADAGGPYASHAVQPESLSLAIQLVIGALDERGLDLPSAKKAEAIRLALDLIEEGMPEAKVLRFVLAAVA